MPKIELTNYELDKLASLIEGSIKEDPDIDVPWSFYAKINNAREEEPPKCPFCYERLEIKEEKLFRGWFWVECHNTTCLFRGPVHPRKQEAIFVLNRIKAGAQ